PPTLFVNKAEIREESHGLLHWGPAQAAVAQGVLESFAEGTIPQGKVEDPPPNAAVWFDWAAADQEQIFANNLEATRAALASAAEGRPRLEELLAIRGEPQNPFFRRAGR